MNLIERNNIKDSEADVLPVFFSSGYEAFVNYSHKDSYLLFTSEVHTATMPVRRYSIKSFIVLQIVYPPVTSSGARLSENDEKQFLDEFTAFVKMKNIGIRIIQSYTYAVFKSVPKGSVSCKFGTYIIDIGKASEEELFTKIDPKGRNKIRNAQKNGVVLKWDGNVLNDFYTLYKSTMERSGKYCEPKAYFKELVSSLGEQNILCGVAYVNDKPQAALLIPYTSYSGYYLHGAMAEKMENPGTMDYLQWEAIRILKKKDVKQYDFVGARLSDVKGTKLEGIQNFKKKFGGELIQGYLWKMDINSVQCKLFDGLLKINSTLKGNKVNKDIIDEEREKSIETT